MGKMAKYINTKEVRGLLVYLLQEQQKHSWLLGWYNSRKVLAHLYREYMKYIRKIMITALETAVCLV